MGRQSQYGAQPADQILRIKRPGREGPGDGFQHRGKYQQLARDAHATGDLIAAEGYQQYAEHYYPLIAAAQE